MTHIKEEYESTGEQSTTATSQEHKTTEDKEDQPQRSEEAEQWRKEETEEETDDRKVDAGDYDMVEDEEIGELSSTLLSDVANLQPSASFQMISPLKVPPKSPRRPRRGKGVTI